MECDSEYAAASPHLSESALNGGWDSGHTNMQSDISNTDFGKF
jgi:hypothetical protein